MLLMIVIVLAMAIQGAPAQENRTDKSPEKNPFAGDAQAIGASDDFGYKAEQQPISYHDLHATILQLLGIDHKKLTYRFNGRDMRLTDVYGVPIPQIVA